MFSKFNLSLMIIQHPWKSPLGVRLFTKIGPHYEYASAVMTNLIFLGVKQCDAKFKVRIIRDISVRKSSRV